jgi:hypothetical protein
MEHETMQMNLKGIFTAGAAAALLQLLVTLGVIVATGVLGQRPDSAQEFFAMYQNSKLLGALQDDLASLVLVGLYLATLPALYFALRRLSPTIATLAALGGLAAVATCFAVNSGFSMMHLSDQYAAAASDAARAQILAAGEAVLAADMWNSSGGYASGILLQGGGVLFSLIMLRSRDFSKVTAITGLLANALDLAQHLLHPFAPPVASIFIMIMGPFYLVWFPMLARDLLRLGRAAQVEASPARTGQAPASV